MKSQEMQLFNKILGHMKDHNWNCNFLKQENYYFSYRKITKGSKLYKKIHLEIKKYIKQKGPENFDIKYPDRLVESLSDCRFISIPEEDFIKKYDTSRFDDGMQKKLIELIK